MTTMGFLGPQGTHSEAAALYLNGILPEAATLQGYPDIFSAMHAVAEGGIESCLVPVENSLEGVVNITLDTLIEGDDLQIERELIWDIHNQLMGRCPAAEIETIYSHPQPLAQCRHFLKAHFPQARLLATASTAQAAELVAASPNCAAAICTSRAGELYGLKTIASEIQDSLTNCTRFYQLRRGPLPPLPPKSGGSALIICQIDGAKAGSLCDVLRIFATYGINMTRIESRPARTELGAYIFFFDLEIEVNRSREPLQAAIAAVREKSLWLKERGQYPIIKSGAK